MYRVRVGPTRDRAAAETLDAKAQGRASQRHLVAPAVTLCAQASEFACYDSANLPAAPLERVLAPETPNAHDAADYLVILFWRSTLVLGTIRGFMREAIALLAWLGGIWLAWRYRRHSWGPILAVFSVTKPQRLGSACRHSGRSHRVCVES